MRARYQRTGNRALLSKIHIHENLAKEDDKLVAYATSKLAEGAPKEVEATEGGAL